MLNRYPRGQRKGLWSSICILSFWSHFCLKEETALRIPELMGLWFRDQEAEPQKANVWEPGARGDSPLQVFISVASQPLQYNCSLSAPLAVHFLCAAAQRGFFYLCFLVFALISSRWGDGGGWGALILLSYSKYRRDGMGTARPTS